MTNTTYDYVESKIRVSGEALAPDPDPELSHGDEVYILSRAVVREVAFPEDNEGNVNRVAKAKLIRAVVVDGEGAEKLLALEHERTTGQMTIVGEITRLEEASEFVTDGDDEFEEDEAF